MLRGRRLPLPQSPLSRWRTTAPANGLRRATATAFFFSTTARRRSDNTNYEPPAAESEREHGKAAQGARPRLRIHKIGVYGDDWSFFQARRSAQPTTRHVELSLQGKNPYGDRDAYERHIAAMNARRRSRESPKRHEPTYKAKEAEDYSFRGLQPRENEFKATQRGKGIYLRRLWGNDEAPRAVAREHQPLPLGRVRQLEDQPRIGRQATTRTPTLAAEDKVLDKTLSHEAPRSTEARAGILADGLQGTIARGSRRPAPDGHRLGADKPQGAANRRVELDSRTEMPPKVKEAITRQYKLEASERKPLFNPRQFSAPDTPLLQAPPQAKAIDAGQYSEELLVATADIGPAESFQRSFVEDPVLMKAKSLAGSSQFSMQSSSRLEMSSEPRFRLVAVRRPTPKKTPKSSQLSVDKPKSLESHISELQMENETEGQKVQPGKISDVRSSRPELMGSERSKTTSDVELKAAQDRPQVDAQDALTIQDEGSGAGDEGDRAVEPMQSPAPDNRTIFEKLFAEQERTKRTDRGQLSSKLKATLAPREKPDDVDRQDMLETARQDALNLGHELSIFRQLFPEQAEPETAQSEPEISRATYEILHPPEDSVMVSLRNEVRNWVSKEGQAQTSWPKAGDYGSHSTVVVISGTSPSLMDTDFYRIAPEGKHMEGWAGGLVKVIQAHDSISYEPLGQYYLMFHSRPSALAYVDEVRRLHELSRRLLHAPGDSGRETAKGSLDQASASPQAFLTDEERVAVRSFTLFSPHITPHISVRMWNTELVKELTAKSNIADILPTLRPEGSTPARVLLKLTSPDGQHGEGRGGLTADELWLTLRDDGRERSAPWVLANLSTGIMPIKPVFISEHYKITVKAEPVPVPVPLELGDDDEVDGGGGQVAGPSPPPREDGNRDAGVDRNERFRRFVLTFTSPTIAKRFVRCWHKRVVYDALLERSVVIDAVAIM